jgi:hypothetical protein
VNLPGKHLNLQASGDAETFSASVYLAGKFLLHNLELVNAKNRRGIQQRYGQGNSPIKSLY